MNISEKIFQTICIIKMAFSDTEHYSEPLKEEIKYKASATAVNIHTSSQIHLTTEDVYLKYTAFKFTFLMF
jgi:hypothetical protein